MGCPLSRSTRPFKSRGADGSATELILLTPSRVRASTIVEQAITEEGIIDRCGFIRLTIRFPVDQTCRCMNLFNALGRDRRKMMIWVPKPAFYGAASS
jgi:hypothetical protein